MDHCARWRAGSALAVLLLLALAGCSAAPPIAQYDFGPEPGARAELAALSLAGARVTAPAWIDRPAITYRLAYADDSRSRAYTRSRWVAPPPALLERRMLDRLSERSAGEGGAMRSAGANGAGLHLELQLEEFSQDFETPERSRARVRVLAQLRDDRHAAPLAQQLLQGECAAPSPDAAGAVIALRAAADLVLDQALAWVRTLPPPAQTQAAAPAR